jgi:DNA (cytosine-5)-methyltransferase 1
MRTVTASKRGEFALVSPTLIQTGYGERPGQTPRVPGLDKPLGTVVAGGSKHALVAAFLAKHYGGVVGHGLERPIGTVTAKDHHALTTATLAPAGADHSAEVHAFLMKFYGSGGQWQGADEPLHTITTKARFGLVTIAGEPYAITDIGMRMLAPRELYAAQGFPADYQIETDADGREIPKTVQIALAGNSVCPPVAASLVGANTLQVSKRGAA